MNDSVISREAGPVVDRVALPISAKFEPLPDITAYELAMLLPLFHGEWLTEEVWTRLGTATRHLTRATDEERGPA